MSFWEKITKGTIKGVGDTVNDLSKTWKGSKQEQDEQIHEENLAMLKQFGLEFGKQNRNWWDSFWDGINRAPRPVFVILIIWYFVFSYTNPTEFRVLNLALATVPPVMWKVLLTIIGFYFAARELSKFRDNFKMKFKPKEFDELMRRTDELRARQKAKEEEMKNGHN